MIEKDEKIIINRVLAGEKDEFRYLVNKYKDFGFSIALKLLKNREDAEESLSDSFLKAYQKLNYFNKNSSFSTWLYRIIYNNSISYIRRKKDTLDLITLIKLDDETSNIELISEYEDLVFEDFELQKEQLIEFLKNAVSELNEIENIVITLYYFESKTLEEIAVITNKSYSNIKIIVHRAKKSLLNNVQLKIKNIKM